MDPYPIIEMKDRLVEKEAFIDLTMTPQPPDNNNNQILYYPNQQVQQVVPHDLSPQQPIQNDFQWTQQLHEQLQQQQQLQLQQDQMQQQQQQQEQLEVISNASNNNYNPIMNSHYVTIDPNQFQLHELNELKVSLYNERSCRALEGENYKRKIERLEQMLQISAADSKKTKDLMCIQSNESAQYGRHMSVLKDNALRHVCELQQQLQVSQNRIDELFQQVVKLRERDKVQKLQNNQLLLIQQDQQELLQAHRQLQQELVEEKKKNQQQRGSEQQEGVGETIDLSNGVLFTPMRMLQQQQQQEQQQQQIHNGNDFIPPESEINNSEDIQECSASKVVIVDDTVHMNVSDECDTEDGSSNNKNDIIERHDNNNNREDVEVATTKFVCKECETLKLQYQELQQKYNLCQMNEECYQEQIEALTLQQKKRSCREISTEGEQK